jgi:dihydrofolate reductase
VRIAGGANVVQQYLQAGLVDEFTLHHAPVLFGKGIRLFDDVGSGVRLDVKQALPSKLTTHVAYKVLREQ